MAIENKVNWEWIKGLLKNVNNYSNLFIEEIDKLKEPKDQGYFDQKMCSIIYWIEEIRIQSNYMSPEERNMYSPSVELEVDQEFVKNRINCLEKELERWKTLLKDSK